MRAEVALVVVHDTADRLAALELVAGDVCDAGKVAELRTVEAAGGELAVDVTLAEPAADPA
jgi:hypothetical protein